jgi:hypothetical protein
MALDGGELSASSSFLFIPLGKNPLCFVCPETVCVCGGGGGGVEKMAAPAGNQTLPIQPIASHIYIFLCVCCVLILAIARNFEVRFDVLDAEISLDGVSTEVEIFQEK